MEELSIKYATAGNQAYYLVGQHRCRGMKFIFLPKVDSFVISL